MMEIADRYPCTLRIMRTVIYEKLTEAKLVRVSCDDEWHRIGTDGCCVVFSAPSLVLLGRISFVGSCRTRV